MDDKIIKKANEEGVDPSVISERYIEECRKDMQALNVKPATTQRLSLLLRLPQHEIQRILLLLLAGHQQGTAAAAQIVQILVRAETDRR